MKKIIILLVTLFFYYSAQSQVSKTVEVTTAGTLESLLTQGEMETITDLTITGNIDARDFRIMRDRLTKLKSLNIPEVTINEYTGSEGTLDEERTYPSNEMPFFSFFNNTTGNGKKTLEAVIFPNNLLSVAQGAFQKCGLKSLNLPSNVKRIETMSFYNCNLTEILLNNSLESIGNESFGRVYTNFQIVIPNSVTTLGYAVFMDSHIQVVTLGSSIKELPTHTFLRCSGLRKIYSLNETPPTFNDRVLSETSLDSIFVPESSVNAYKNTKGWDAYYSIIYPISSSNTYTITVNKNAGGIVKDGGQDVNSVIVEPGSTKTFTIEPLQGYDVVAMTYNDVDVLPELNNNQYTTPEVNADAVLNVTFQKIEYELTIQSADNGVSVLFTHFSDTPTLQFVALNEWELNSVLYNDVDVTSELVNGVYKVPSISANGLLNVSFVSSSLAVNSIDGPEIKVYGSARGFVVEGLPFGDDVQLYNTLGQLIDSGTSFDKKIDLQAEKNHIYIIKTPYKSFKIFLK